MGNFELDTRISGGNGHDQATLSSDWEIWGPNGGYLTAIALRDAGAEAQIKRPVTLTAHYLSVAKFAVIDLEVVALRRGRRAESFRVSMRQGDRAILEAMAWTAAPGPGLDHDRSDAPVVPPPAELRPVEELRSTARGRVVSTRDPRKAAWHAHVAPPEARCRHRHRASGGA